MMSLFYCNPSKFLSVAHDETADDLERPDRSLGLHCFFISFPEKKN